VTGVVDERERCLGTSTVDTEVAGHHRSPPIG
jgi:hypothetical protein